MNLRTLSCCEHIKSFVSWFLFLTHSTVLQPLSFSNISPVQHTVDLPIIILRNIFSNPPFVMLILTSFYWLGRGSGTLSISICPCVWKSWNLLKTFSRLQIRCEPSSALSACFVTGPCQSSLFPAQSYIWQQVKIVSIATDAISKIENKDCQNIWNQPRIYGHWFLGWIFSGSKIGQSCLCIVWLQNQKCLCNDIKVS